MKEKVEEILSIIMAHAKPQEDGKQAQCVCIQKVQNLYLTIQVETAEVAEAVADRLRSVLPQ